MTPGAFAFRFARAIDCQLFVQVAIILARGEGETTTAARARLRRFGREARED